MTHSFDGYNHLIRLVRGERLSDALKQFAKETHIEGAWLNGLGGAEEVTLGYYDLPAKKYRFKTFTGLRELTGMQGNFAFNEQGEIMFHLHGTLADQNYQVIGGHIKDLVAGATVEIFVHRSYKPMRRKMDETVGLPVLDLD